MKVDLQSDSTIVKLFREYCRPLTVFAMQYVKQKQAAEDIVQELFLDLAEKKDLHNLPNNHLYQMVRSRCLNNLKYNKVRLKNNPEVHQSLTSEPLDPFEQVSLIELEHQYLKALESISPRSRRVFEMSRLEGLRNQEIAEALGLSIRTVETHITLTIKVMRKKLRRYLTVIWILFASDTFLFTCNLVFSCN